MPSLNDTQPIQDTKPMYNFTVQCPITAKLYNLKCNNYSSANILENQLKRNSVNYQLNVTGV